VNRLAGALTETALRAYVRTIIESLTIAPRLFRFGRSTMIQLDTVGWSVVTIKREDLRPALRSARDLKLHAATHNDSGQYAVLLSARPIRSVAGACDKITKAGAWSRPITTKTLSIRF